MEIKKVGVIGAGQMGNGIAQVFATAGFEVVMRDIEERFVESGMNNIKKLLKKNVEKGKISQEESTGVLSRVKGTIDLEGRGKRLILSWKPSSKTST